jgi:SpoVK/Ycf46/Vps4 family AAA+-type ATPase
MKTSLGNVHGKQNTSHRGKEGFMGDWGIGCLIQIGFLFATATLLSQQKLTSVLAYALILALPALVVRFICRARDIDDEWFERLLGPGFLIFAFILTAIHPLHFETDTDGQAPAATENQQASTDSQQASSDGNVNVQEADAQEVSLDEALAELDSLVGLEPVKAEVRKIANSVKIAQARKAAGMQTATVSYHMVFTGNPGTGKTTVARILAKIFRALGVLEKGQLVETDRSGLVAGYQGQTAIKANETIDKAIGGILFIDEAYTLAGKEGKGDSYGDEALATLLKRMEDDRDRLIVIVAGYTDEMRDFINANPGLKSRFNRYLDFPDYSGHELAEMFRMRAKKNQYELSPDANEALEKYMADAVRKRDRQFGNGRFARNLFEKALERQAERLAATNDLSPEVLATLTASDIMPPREADANAPSLEEAFAELNGLVGLDSVKDEVRKLAAYCKMARERETQGLETAPVSYNFVFTGNPGTGKTTVARIIAKIFRALGVLDKGQLVETDRSGLVAEYVGQTATKTNRKIDEAIGGILFIDEAYALATDSYGQEAIATLLKRMEDDRGRLVVIVAGYTDEMKTFMDANAGLQSRFSRHIVFRDYSARELGAIFRLTARKNKYVLSKDLEHWLDPAIGLWTKDRDRKFGNGRYVRNLFEKAVERQALRLSGIDSPTKEQLVTLTLADVGISLKDPDASDED